MAKRWLVLLVGHVILAGSILAWSYYSIHALLSILMGTIGLAIICEGLGVKLSSIGSLLAVLSKIKGAIAGTPNKDK